MAEILRKKIDNNVSYKDKFIQALLTCLLHTALLEKLTSSQLVKKFLACYGTRKFIIAFTFVLYLSLS